MKTLFPQFKHHSISFSPHQYNQMRGNIRDMYDNSGIFWISSTFIDQQMAVHTENIWQRSEECEICVCYVQVIESGLPLWPITIIPYAIESSGVLSVINIVVIIYFLFFTIVIGIGIRFILIIIDIIIIIIKLQNNQIRCNQRFSLNGKKRQPSKTNELNSKTISCFASFNGRRSEREPSRL